MTAPRLTGRWALQNRSGERFYPTVGEYIGFDSPEAAMRHVLELMPGEVGDWFWVPITVAGGAYPTPREGPR